MSKSTINHIKGYALFNGVMLLPTLLILISKGF